MSVYRHSIDETYNSRVKSFSDGTTQISLFPHPRLKKSDKKRAKKQNVSSVEKQISNKAQSVERVFDYCRENLASWFVTLTFAPWACDRYNYDECYHIVVLFRKKLNRMGIRSLFVPEQHQDGAIHFHGVVFDDLPVERAMHPRSGLPLVDRWGREVYNIPAYTWGFSTASRPDSQAKVAHYISCYITKAIEWLPKGRQCYLVSKGLLKPTISHEDLQVSDLAHNKDFFHFFRAFPSPVGPYYFFEGGGAEDGEVNKIKSLPESVSVPEPVGWIDVYDELEEAAPY